MPRSRGLVYRENIQRSRFKPKLINLIMKKESEKIIYLYIYTYILLDSHRLLEVRSGVVKS